MTDRLVVNGGPPIGLRVELPAWPPQDPEIQAALMEAFESRSWAYAPSGLQDRLAHEFSEAHGARHGIFLSNGTTAILGSLVALGVAPGDEVVLPAFTCTTTVLPVLFLGARPVFVDCDPETLCLSPERVAEALTPRTKAIIAVHMYTAIADLDALLEISTARGVPLLEDCAHLPGARWDDSPVGSRGAMGCFSFQARKTITSGEGGMVITNRQPLFDRLHQFVHVGKLYEFAVDASLELDFLLSTNASASTFQAAVVLAQFRKLDELLQGYEKNHRRLAERMADATRVRLQSQGAKTTKPGFFKVCLLFDRGPLSGVSIDSILHAAQAEGLPLSRTYGAAYLDLRIRNIMKRQGWTRGACPVAEELAMERTAILDHWWLGTGDDGVAFICRVLERLESLAGTIPARPGPEVKRLFRRPASEA